MSVKRTKAAQSEHTRALLVGIARELFTERGYAGTATEEVVRRAGVTRGALYHQFKDKRDLFRAVVEDVQQGVMERVVAALGATADPWEQMQAGIGAFLDACMDPAVQRIVLLDAPSVLSWETWREIDARYGFGLTRTALQGLMDLGLIEPRPVDALAHMLLGALSEGGLVIARADDPIAARAQVGETIALLMRGLRTGNGGSAVR
jgi:AcrR family transcriptional regulator